jgi:hypothetical protein
MHRVGEALLPLLLGLGRFPVDSYPLVNIQKAIENGDL